MLINCWDCKHFQYDQSWDGEKETRFYMCRHPRGNRTCLLPAHGGLQGDCPRLDQDAANVEEQRSE